MTQYNPNLEIAAAKSTLRKAGRDCRAALSCEARKTKSQQLCARLQELWASLMQAHPESARQATAVYLANELEADVDDFARALLLRGLVVVAPRLNIEPPFYTLERTLWNVEIILFGKPPAFVRQPHRFQGGRACELSEIGVFCIPGVAFDANGNRIGQGGGWYDKVLCKAPHAVVVGVCFDCQLFLAAPHEVHDRAVHYVVTESQILKTGVPFFAP